MASENTPFNYDTGDAAAQYSSPSVGEDGPGNTTADSAGGPGESASQYSGGFGGAPTDSVGQVWTTQSAPSTYSQGAQGMSGPSSGQYSSPAVSETVNRSPRKGEPTE